MASFNKVIILGNLTRDPELKYTPKGTAIASISLATNRVWTNDAGEKKEEVTFVNITLFGRTAENVGQYMRKGRPMLVEGRLKLDQWDDKQTGQKKSRLSVVGETVQFLGSAGGNAGGEAAPAKRRPGAQTDDPNEVTGAGKSEPLEGDGPRESDDVPF